MLYLYGPRADRPPDRARRAPRARARWRGARYRLRADVLWLALVPAGLVAVRGLPRRSPAATRWRRSTPRRIWGRHFAGPYVAVWDGLQAAFEGARQLLSFQRAHVYFPAGGGSPFVAAGHNLMLLAFLPPRCPPSCGVLRTAAARLRRSTCWPRSRCRSPTRSARQPLMSLPRFLVVLFPLSHRGSARWLAAHPAGAAADARRARPR